MLWAMNRNHLAIFHAVAQAGSISRGAGLLRISQPAVSKQIAELESALGVQLLDRLAKGSRLTNAGQLLADYTRRLSTLEREAERALEEYRGLKRGRLAVGASTTIAAYLLPEVFAEFHRRHPQVQLQLEIANTRNVQRYLMDGSVEIALTEGLIETEDLQSEVFHQDELIAIATPGHRLLQKKQVTVRELCREPWVIREEGSGTRAVIEKALKKYKALIRPVISLASTEAIKRAVAWGLGVAVISRLTVASEIRARTLAMIPVADLVIHRPLYLQTLRGQSRSCAAAEFLKILQQSASRKGSR